jgi:regulatory protein
VTGGQCFVAHRHGRNAFVEFRSVADEEHRLIRSVGPAPDAAELRDAALAYLARYAATEAGLLRVLERRVDRWARRIADAEDAETIAAKAAAARGVVREVVARLVAAGVVNDVAFAESRARSLTRGGRSRRSAAAHLAAKGVDPATARAALPDDDTSELAAALVLARKRRIGPFRRDAPPDDAGLRRELGMLARAGFPLDVARRALAMEPGEAETLVNLLRR